MILVVGATGRVGEQIVRTLRRLNLEVRALVRKGSEYYWLNDTGCRYFFGDVRDPRSLARASRGMRYLVSAVGVTVEQRHNHHENVTVQGHRALVEAARANGVEKLVLVSCAGVQRGYPVVAFDARARAEAAVADSGLDYTILRATTHEHPFLELAWRAQQGQRVWLPGPGTNRIAVLPTQDLARMAAASLDLAAVRNQILEVGGGEVHTAREVVSLAAEVAGAPDVARALPGAALDAVTRLPRPLRRYANRTAALRVWFNEDFVVDGAAVASRFGLPLTPLREAMKQSWGLWQARGTPEEREKNIVHRQFYATLYQPGEVPLASLPSGPPPRED